MRAKSGLILLVLLCNVRAFSFPRDFVGYWVTVRNTRGIPCAEVTDSIKISLYGACSPVTCEWGESPATTFGSSVEDKDHKRAMVLHNFSHARTSTTILLTDIKHIRLENFTTFIDNSPRENYHSVDQLRRATKAEFDFCINKSWTEMNVRLSDYFGFRLQ